MTDESVVGNEKNPEASKKPEEKAIEVKGTEEKAVKASEDPCENDDPQIAEIIEKAPPEVRESLREVFGMVRSIGPAPHPLFSKFDTSNINTYLENIRRDDEHEYKLKSTNRWFYLIYAILLLIALGLAIAYLSNKDRDLLLTLLQIFVGIAGGIGAGYGIAKRNE